MAALLLVRLHPTPLGRTSKRFELSSMSRQVLLVRSIGKILDAVLARQQTHTPVRVVSASPERQ